MCDCLANKFLHEDIMIVITVSLRQRTKTWQGWDSDQHQEYMLSQEDAEK